MSSPVPKKEILGIDLGIMVHEIPNYLDAKPIWQCHRPVHLRKEVAIKAKVEKILKDGFIYPIPLKNWVYNLILVAKR